MKKLEVQRIKDGEVKKVPMGFLELKLSETVFQGDTHGQSISDHAQEKGRELGFDYFGIEQNHTYINNRATRMTVSTINYYQEKWWKFW